jgi:hypothetical protein
MKTFFRVLLSKYYWVHQFSPPKFLSSFFAAVGVIVSGVGATKEVLTLLHPQSNWLQQWLSQNQWTALGGIALSALVFGLITLAPTTKVSSRLRERDLTITIEVGDLFDSSDTLIIGTNCTFDTKLIGGPISAESIQGQFTTRYYDLVQHLDTDINAQLQGQEYELLTIEAKQIGKLQSYPMGTAAKVDAKGCKAYLIAMARMNSHGVASSSREDLRISLSALWQFIAQKGGGLPRLRSPILGTGFAKLVTPRQEIVKDILRSLVAAASTERFCDRFTVVISVNDYLEHHIDLLELGDYLRYLTSYTEIRSGDEVGRGIGIGA